ncbi:helix-turn-helix transcriptional regulator [Microbispora sp. ATCC PTA-5024]|uniref:helix-turn-helix transcriptional regulator n=1 Tax=Microbispora sp. ATCC PTA-5024 TaxID=316330 RepID=UPI0003DB70AA|nr:LuxR family transcriptional regulator [Microbispora sp. ATCC PTA-5024]ETK30494.1 hypothetical protein MPTA5024_39950 [Microbispora sp. ATCC PTA-5024]
MIGVTPPLLYGRAAERAELDALIEAAAADSRSAVRVLTGEPGAGKTALLGCALARAAGGPGASADPASRPAIGEPAVAAAAPPGAGRGGFAVLTTRGVPSESRLPFAGLHRLLRPVTRLVGGLPAPQRKALGAALGQAEGPSPDRFLISVAVLTLLSELAERGPVLAVVDDAHWLDAPSLDALAFAAARFEAEGVVLLAAVRAGHLSPLSGLPALPVDGLTPGACDELITSRAEGPVATAVRDRLVAHTRGNPLALGEIVDALTPDQLAGRATLPHPLPIGPGLERAYLERVSALPAPTRSLLLLAAAEAEMDAGTLLRAAAHVRIEVSAIEPAESAGLIQVSEAGVRFRHPLMRSAVYQGAGLARRRWAHQVLGEVSGPGDRRPWHRAAAALEPDDGLAAELEESAGRARVRSGYAAAAVALERAAELTGSEPARVRRLVVAAWDRWLAGHTGSAVRLLDQARRSAEAAGDTRMLGEIDFLRGTVDLRGGVTGDAYRSLVSAAGRLEPETALRALMGAAEAASYAGDDRMLAAVARRAEEAADVPGDRAALIRAYLAGVADAVEGDLPRAVGPLREALRIAERVDDPDALVWAATAALLVGDDALAHALPARAAAIARARGAVTAVPQAVELLVHTELWSGRLAIAGANALEGLRLATDTGQLNCACHLRALLALHAAIEGDTAACRERARDAMTRAREHDLGLAWAVATWALAFGDLSQGRYGEAAQRLARMAEAGSGQGHRAITLLSAPHFAEAAARSGDRRRAGAALARFRAWAETVESTWALALVERCLALLADPAEPGEADRHFRRALDLHARSERDFERARTALLYGAHLRKQRRRGQARHHAREALEIFERLGAVQWEERARGELRATGETVAGPGAGDAAGLTAQQFQIARFIAEGATNREVAARLFVSPRTVDYHVRNIFATLGIASRGELIRRFRGGRAPGS